MIKPNISSTYLHLKFLKNLFFIFIFLFYSNLFSQTTVKFAAIGDYGLAGPDELAVANLVKSWNPDFIITVGDNNYEWGSWSTIDTNIGQYYHEYIYPYIGNFGTGSTVNRFWPCLGNHDLYTNYGFPYYNYFTLPNNERYYDYVVGNVHFFSMNSDFGGYEYGGVIWEPDGIDSNSVQAQWLKQKLAASTSKWKVVYIHHPPYLSILPGYLDIFSKIRWPFKKWGASVVLSGHAHWYERLNLDDFPYFINGLGGEGIGSEDLGPPRNGSQKIYFDKFGAQLIQSYNDSLVLKFINVDNELIDSYQITEAPKTLKLTCVLEGPFIEAKNSMTRDTAMVYLRNKSSPFALVDSAKGCLNSNGYYSFNFHRISNDVEYYIVVKHRNSLETWSAVPKKFIANNLTYNFSNSISKAYGNNLKFVNGKYCIYSGDVVQDGVIDGNDSYRVDNDAFNYSIGYEDTDLNGDRIIDARDLSIIDENTYDLITVKRP